MPVDRLNSFMGVDDMNRSACSETESGSTEINCNVAVIGRYIQSSDNAWESSQSYKFWSVQLNYPEWENNEQACLKLSKGTHFLHSQRSVDSALFIPPHFIRKQTSPSGPQQMQILYELTRVVYVCYCCVKQSTDFCSTSSTTPRRYLPSGCKNQFVPMMLKSLRQKTLICQFAGGFAVKAK